MNSDISTKPWLSESNDRFREIIRTLISLSTGALFLPMFFIVNFRPAREFDSLIDVLSWEVYLSWLLLAISILSGLFFFYTSAAWAWVSWGKKPFFFGKMVKDTEKILHCLEISFWICVLSFSIGVALDVWFMMTFSRSVPN